jgi:very-short-patch-repair endonuclease
MHDWARGRCWNKVLEWHVLGKAYRLDLFWPDDGLVVEVDGDDHRERWKYADDRHRDAQLQLLGHDVVRFTNDQVLTDPQATALTIRDLLLLRRSPLSQK